jgi:hypothetical protein
MSSRQRWGTFEGLSVDFLSALGTYALAALSMISVVEEVAGRKEKLERFTG